MDRITLEDFRCFHARQSARLAPLTLLVGENSTGKTSFMALVRALWEVAFRDAIPDFKGEPYDLGSFAEVAHHRGGRGGRADTFEAGFHVAESERLGVRPFSFDVKFGRRGTAPVPVWRRVSNRAASMTLKQMNGTLNVDVEIGSASWHDSTPLPFNAGDETELAPLYLALFLSQRRRSADQDWIPVDELIAFRHQGSGSIPFASAPVRSKPRRTYDPARPARDPEGDYVPMYLAHVFRENKRRWSKLKARLESFGVDAGLFDELDLKSLGSRDSEPFQVQVRKRGTVRKGPWRNLIDVGYGVSQVLPVITELLRPDAASMFLLQQPEVHLHPSAQAALGTLLCEVAATDGRQLIVETHSDHLINRVRMDVRDADVRLSPNDVSILYFERDELEVRIHSLRLDGEGNVLDAPASYGGFFMAEIARSLQH